VLSRAVARGLMSIVPEKGVAVVTLNPDFNSILQAGTVTGYSATATATVTGTGTSFLTGPYPLSSGSVVVANNVTMTVLSVTSDTSLTLTTTLTTTFSGVPWYVNDSVVINVYNAWIKQTTGGLSPYGTANVEQDKTIIKIPDIELNPAYNGRNIRARDKITFGGVNYRVTSGGGNLKTDRTVWDCEVQQEFN